MLGVAGQTLLWRPRARLSRGSPHDGEAAGRGDFRAVETISRGEHGGGLCDVPGSRKPQALPGHGKRSWEATCISLATIAVPEDSWRRFVRRRPRGRSPHQSRHCALDARRMQSGGRRGSRRRSRSIAGRFSEEMDAASGFHSTRRRRRIDLGNALFDARASGRVGRRGSDEAVAAYRAAAPRRDARPGSARFGDDAVPSGRCASRRFGERAGERDGAAGGGARGLRGALEDAGRASNSAPRLGEDADQSGNAVLSAIGPPASGTARLEEAVAAHRAVRSRKTRRASVQLESATTKGNLGGALEFRAGTREGPARDAVAAFARR